MSEIEGCRCPAVHFSTWGVVRCTKPMGHRGNRRIDGDVWHSGPGQTIGDDGEPDVFGAAWRYPPELVAPLPRRQPTPTDNSKEQ